MDLNRVVGSTMNEMIYESKYDDWKSGKITESEWIDFCMNFIEKLLNQNRDILYLLKNI